MQGWNILREYLVSLEVKLMLKDGKISQNEIPVYFPELSSEDIAEVIDEIMQLA